MEISEQAKKAAHQIHTGVVCPIATGDSFNRATTLGEKEEMIQAAINQSNQEKDAEIAKWKQQWAIMARACGNWRTWDNKASDDHEHNDWKVAAKAIIERDALLKELEDTKEKLNFCKQSGEEVSKENVRNHNENITLRSQVEELKKFAAHPPSCHFTEFCTCGLTDLLRGVGE